MAEPRERKRLKKQPRRRQMQTSVAMPRLRVPKTARRRRRRNQRQWLQRPKVALKTILFSPRWISLVLLAVAVYALYLVAMDESFYLTYIPVDGSETIPPAEIVGVSGLAGAHVFSVDPTIAAERINEVAGVTSASVTLEWPNMVAIHVTEDSPIAIWQDNGVEYWVNRNGALIPARTNGLGLLRIESEIPPSFASEVMAETAVSTEDTGASEETTSAAPALNTSLPFIPQEVLAGALQLRELRPNIERLYYRPSGGLSYEDGRGWRVYFGTGNDMSQKLVVYETIVDDLVARGLSPTYISVSNQEKPYYAVQ